MALSSPFRYAQAWLEASKRYVASAGVALVSFLLLRATSSRDWESYSPPGGFVHQQGNEMASISEVINKLERMEGAAGGDVAQLREVEQFYENLCEQAPGHIPLLRARNQFRVRNGDVLALPRTRILLGLINGAHFPNFHTVPLMRVADVVSLSTVADDRAVDRLTINLLQEDLPDAMERLPRGFTPDLYWDPQICGASIVPLGLERMPCLTVAGLCHHFKTLEIENTASLYDVLCPLSTLYADYFQELFPDKMVLDIPFGANWGSFKEIIARPEEENRDIDILLSFGAEDGVTYGNTRSTSVRLFEAFKEKYGNRYNLVAVSGLGREEYLRHIQRSKILLNAVGQHGPYNYRNCEGVNAGAVVMQIDARYPIGDQKIEQYFTPDEEIVLFDETNFEEKALALLEQPDRVKEIADRARERLDGEYAYEALYLRMFQEIGDRLDSFEVKRLKPEDALKHRTMALFHGGKDKATYIALAIAQAPKALGMSIESALLAYYDHVSLFNETALVSLIKDRSLAKALLEQNIQGARGLYAKIKAPTLVDHWNLLVQEAQLGVVDPELVEAVSAIVSDPENREVKALGILSPVKLPSHLPALPGNALETKAFKLISTDFMTVGPDDVKKADLIRQYMAFCTNELRLAALAVT